MFGEREPGKLDPPYRFALLASSASAFDPPCPLYRGSLPKLRNAVFLDTLKLRTIISLTPKSLKDYEEEGSFTKATQSTYTRLDGRTRSLDSVVQWMEERSVHNVHVKVGKAKDGALPFTPATVKLVLEMLMDRDRYPIYLHDLDGSDVLSMMGAALRKLQGWSEKSWLEEMFLRQPPPEPEHLTFLRRLLSTSLPQSEPPIAIVVPPSPKRVPWLWPQGLPVAPATGGKKSSQHISMRIKVLEDETAQEAKETNNGDRRGAVESRDRRLQGATAAGISDEASARTSSTSRTSITSIGSDLTLRPPAGDDDASTIATRSRVASADEQSELSTTGDSVSQRSEEEIDDEDEELWDEEEDELPVLSQTIEALDLG
ncbi:protein-tyrosine phosphatase [Microbotryomycetes sp. JL201]|nr:protein-tyrosine phosphatase [Microbotryomycetes sp. JL201]